MHPFNEASRLNSLGVNALLDGDDDLAMTTFAECIKIMKNVVAAKTSTVEMHPQSKMIGEGGSQSVELPTVQVYGQLQESILFNQAIIIPDSCSQSPPSNQQDTIVYTAVVVFNLAIAYHRRGKKMGLAAYTIKAEKLYSLALKLVGDNSGSSNNDNDNTILGVLVKLASINNLLEIRFESGDHDLAQDGLNQVFDMLLSCELSESMCSYTPDVKALLMNILLLKPPQVAPAA